MIRRLAVILLLALSPTALVGCNGDDPTVPADDKRPAPDALVGVWVATGEWDPQTSSRIYAARDSLVDTTLGFAFAADQAFTAHTDYIIGESGTAWTDLHGTWEQRPDGDFFGTCVLPGKWVEYTFTVYQSADGELVMHTLRAWYIELAIPNPLPVR